MSDAKQFQACCSIPPVVAKGYSPKGKYIDIDGMKTCTSLPFPLQFLNLCHLQQIRSLKATDHLNPSLTDTTGPSGAKEAILIIYDIFGFAEQTLQGADILAHSDESHQYQVFIPDFLEGSYAEHSWLPPDTKEKGEKLGAFFQGPAAPPKTASRIPNVVKLITEKTGGTIQTWGALGMCWGGKVGVVLAET